MKTVIDKLAFIEIQNKKVLVTLSRGRDAWYIPGGKREKGESDMDALVREIKEELSVGIDSASARLYGIFEAQAHAQPQGVIVRMTCYVAPYKGILVANREIEKLDFFSYAQKHLTAPVDYLIFDDLKRKKLIK